MKELFVAKTTLAGHLRSVLMFTNSVLHQYWEKCISKWPDTTGHSITHNPWYTVVLLCPLCNWLWKCASSSCQKEQGQRPHDFSWSERRQGRRWRGSSACCGWPPPCSAGCPSPTACPPGSLEYFLFVPLQIHMHRRRQFYVKDEWKRIWPV